MKEMEGGLGRAAAVARTQFRHSFAGNRPSREMFTFAIAFLCRYSSNTVYIPAADAVYSAIFITNSAWIFWLEDRTTASNCLTYSRSILDLSRRKCWDRRRRGLSFIHMSEVVVPLVANQVKGGEWGFKQEQFASLRQHHHLSGNSACIQKMESSTTEGNFF